MKQKKYYITFEVQGENDLDLPLGYISGMLVDDVTLEKYNNEEGIRVVKIEDEMEYIDKYR